MDLYERQPLFADVDMFLRQRAFQLFCFDGVAGRRLAQQALLDLPKPGRQQALWTDAIYVRKFEDWTSMEDSSLAKLALVFDVVVDAPDHTHFILSMIDQRQKTDFATQYASRKRWKGPRDH